MDVPKVITNQASLLAAITEEGGLVI